MKKILLSFILSVLAIYPTFADGYTGVLVTDNAGQKTYYLFKEKPSVRYQNMAGVMNACLFATGQDVPVVSVPLTGGAKLTVNYESFVRVNLNSAGYATFSAKDDSFIATDGVTAYKAAVDGELITLTALEGNIPAGTGVLLYGETPNTKVNLPVTTSGSSADVSGNDFLATTQSDGSLAIKGENVWVLGDSNEFLKYTGTEFIHNRAYLVHEQTTNAKPMRMIFAENQPSEIDAIITEKPARNGKYIENGNIIIIKNGIKYNVAGQAIK